MQPNYVSAPNTAVSHLSDFRSGLYLSGQCLTHFGLESWGKWCPAPWLYTLYSFTSLHCWFFSTL